MCAQEEILGKIKGNGTPEDPNFGLLMVNFGQDNKSLVENDGSLGRMVDVEALKVIEFEIIKLEVIEKFVLVMHYNCIKWKI
jgi:hypothetical protein